MIEIRRIKLLLLTFILAGYAYLAIGTHIPPLFQENPFQKLLSIPSQLFPSLSAQKPISWNRYPIPKRISLEEHIGKSVGTSTGYSSLDILLAPDYPSLRILPFIEIQGQHFYNDTYGGSIGVGGRYFVKDAPLLIGLNAFYNYQEGQFNSFQQASIGLEFIGRGFSISANGYMPIGPQEQVKTCVFDEYIGDYRIVRRQRQSDFYAFDMTTYLTAFQKGDFSIRVSGGPYLL
ncbi:MAG: inverse autotransporter beta domain-containing protein, partial [Chlamydiales bacterium]|nr:inverse autotransporter beta domain-containing protein [Chlamydiales bacterium]